MKSKHIAMVISAGLLTVGLVPLASAQDAFRAAPEGIEVITVVGKRPTPPEGIEVITVVGKRPAPTVASNCVNAVMADGATGRESARQAIRDCIDQARLEASRS